MTRVVCPVCDGRGFVWRETDHPYHAACYPADCPAKCELGWHSLPLRFAVCLRDTVLLHSVLAEHYNPDAIPVVPDHPLY